MEKSKHLSSIGHKPKNMKSLIKHTNAGEPVDLTGPEEPIESLDTAPNSVQTDPKLGPAPLKTTSTGISSSSSTTWDELNSLNNEQKVTKKRKPRKKTPRDKRLFSYRGIDFLILMVPNQYIAISQFDINTQSVVRQIKIQPDSNINRAVQAFARLIITEMQLEEILLDENVEN